MSNNQTPVDTTNYSSEDYENYIPGVESPLYNKSFVFKDFIQIKYELGS